MAAGRQAPVSSFSFPHFLLPLLLLLLPGLLLLLLLLLLLCWMHLHVLCSRGGAGRARRGCNLSLLACVLGCVRATTLWCWRGMARLCRVYLQFQTGD